jgi:tRNA threonylcarbamoyladenosine biosynthesis protein TsaB
MKFAAFETSTEWCSAALWLDGEVIALERQAGQQHSQLLLPMLEALLQRTSLKIDALEAVAFAHGPGSFTGLRIACGVAQGIALARKLPVFGVSTLEALAEESGAARVVACLDARMREVYYSAHEKHEGRWREIVSPRCVPPADVALPSGDGWVGCGNGFAVYGSFGMKKILPGIHPTATAVARLAAPRLAAGEGVDAALAVPVYVRDKVALTEKERAVR